MTTIFPEHLNELDFGRKFIKVHSCSTNNSFVGNTHVSTQKVTFYNSLHQEFTIQLNFHEDTTTRAGHFFTNIISNEFLEPLEVSELQKRIGITCLENAKKMMFFLINKIDFLDEIPECSIYTNKGIIFEESLINATSVNPYYITIEHEKLTANAIHFLRNLSFIKHDEVVGEDDLKQVFYFKAINGLKLFDNYIGISKVRDFLEVNNIPSNIEFLL